MKQVPDATRLKKLLAGFKGEILINESMNRHTSLKVGGTADLYAIPADINELELLAGWLDNNSIPRMVIGGGYNLLVRDGGIRGAVISLQRLDRIDQLDSTIIKVWAGVENLGAVRFGQKLGLGGIGFISGIPGTIGGAVRMNAGAYSNSLLDRVCSLTMLRHGAIQEIPLDQFSYGYRRLDLMADDIILAVTLQLEHKEPLETEIEISSDIELRRKKHHVGFPSAGSFFKNPPEHAAWRLIDESGMRGYSVGGAQMSEIHSNFLVNRGGATAEDCLKLSGLVKEAVLKSSGIELEEEVRIVGEEP